MSYERSTFELPGEAAAGERPGSGTSRDPVRRRAAHFPRTSSEPYQYSSPAPAVVSSAIALDTTASATQPVSKGRRYARAGSAATQSVCASRPSSPAFSVSAVRASCRLRQLRCWVAPGRDSSSSASSVRRVPYVRSSESLRLVNTRPLFLHTSVGVNPSRRVPGVQEAAVPAAGAEGAGCHRTNVSGSTSGNAAHNPPTASSIDCHRPTPPVTHCARGTVSAWPSAGIVFPSWQ